MPIIDIIRNPFLSAMMYDLCFNLPPETVKKLPLVYRKILKSPIRTKNFCENSSLDTKLKFFNACGLNNSLVILPDKIQSSGTLKRVLEKYKEEKTAAAQKEHAILGAYITTDKETEFLLGLMAQTIHTKSYLLNLDLNKIGYHFKKWNKQLDTPDHLELIESIESADLIVQTLLNSFITIDSVTTHFEVNQMDMKILFYLYRYRHSYVLRDRIWDMFAGYYQKKHTTVSLKRILLNGYIRKHADWQKMQYTITPLGIKTVNDFIKIIFKANKF